MSVFDDDYASHYDEMYTDKDYIAEVSYIETLIREHTQPGPLSILDLGSGNRAGTRSILPRAGIRLEESIRVLAWLLFCRSEEIVLTRRPEEKRQLFCR